MADASAEHELSYNEFVAEQKRKKARKNLQEGDSELAAKRTADATPAPSMPGAATTTERHSVLGGAFESESMEAAMVVVILVDTFTSMLLFLHFDLGTRPLVNFVSQAVYEQALLMGADLLATVAFLEGVTATGVHGLSIVTHPGRALDAFYVALCVFASMHNLTFGVRLVGLVRLWRLYGMHLRSVAALETQTAELASQIGASTLREQQQQLLIQRLTDDVVQAAETRNHHDQVMANYRSQIENLREALEIAASHFVQTTSTIDKTNVQRKFVVKESGEYSRQENIANLRNDDATQRMKQQNNS